MKIRYGLQFALCHSSDRLRQRWSGRNYGLENLRLDGSFLPVIDYLKKDLAVRTDWQVKEVNYEDLGRIVLTNARGEVRRCRLLLGLGVHSWHSPLRCAEN